ncbi:MAG: TrmH family RNA methyltransferase [Bacilli bacterium]|nr:TrmH family RNA methyltransferase [Bacilli bacterium]
MVYFHSEMNRNETWQWMETKCNELSVQFIENDKVFNRLSEKENCYAIGVFVKYENDLAPNNNHLVLVNPSNSGNMGTIIRTMLGFGCSDLAIIRPGGDVFDPKTIRASMGAVFNIRFSYFDDFSEYLDFSVKHHVYPFMLQAKTSLTDIVPKTPYSLVFGNEATGLETEYLSHGTPLIIKHLSDIDSLNLPIAVGIALYQFTKMKAAE